MLAPPFISLLDPILESEGSVDPLSLARTYERLADRMLPAITVRMSRIRFVTAMCAGSLVCADYDADAVAADGVTPPWLVYEWFVIEALARAGQDVDRQAIAGLRKVRRCLDSQRPVSAASYLKTPKVFGFTGIFRRFAVAATILGPDLELDDGGWELLRAWEKDEDLGGFIDSGGSGHELRRTLREAVRTGMDRGHTVSRPAAFWERVAHHLVPTRLGKREQAVLRERLRGTHELARELADALVVHGKVLAREEEAAYLRSLRQRASPELSRLLAAIDAYESLCRPITDAFALLRHQSTQSGGVEIGPGEFAAHAHASALTRATAEGCRRVEHDPALLDLEPDVRLVLDEYIDVRAADDLFRAVVRHHERAQREKPPDGKRSWLERGRGETIVVRPAYTVGELDPPGDLYVHDYRTRTLSRFLRDLGALS